MADFQLKINNNIGIILFLLLCSYIYMDPIYNENEQDDYIT